MNQSSSSRRIGFINVMLSAVIFGFTPILAKLSYSGGNNGVNMSFLRALLPLPVLCFIARKDPWPSRKRWPILLLLGALQFGTTLLLYSSYSTISPGIATTIHFLYPLFVVLYETIVRKHKLGRSRAAGLALALIGSCLFLDLGGEMLHPQGAILAMLSGLCYAGYILLLGRESKGLSLYRLASVTAISGAALCFIVGLALGQLNFALTPSAWLNAFAVAMLGAIVAAILFQSGVRSVGESDAAIFSLLEPITSIFFSILLLGDHLSPAKFAGCLLILAGLWLTSARKQDS